MHPTYTFSEIKELVKNVDTDSLGILQELLEEERECFSEFEMRAFRRFIVLKNKELVSNGIQFSYLLSYN